MQKSDSPTTVLIDKPKRPLSAYNIFFKQEREKILTTATVRPDGKPVGSHGKIGFAALARNIASKWKALDLESRHRFKDLAAKEKAKYKEEKNKWKKANRSKKKTEANALQFPSSSEGVSNDQLQYSSLFEDVARRESSTPNKIDILEGSIISDEKNNASLMESNTSKQNSIRVENSSLDDRDLHREDLRKKEQDNFRCHFSSNISLGDNEVLNETSPPVVEASIPHKQQITDVSGLVRKLDNECIDLLCDLLCGGMR